MKSLWVLSLLLMIGFSSAMPAYAAQAMSIGVMDDDAFVQGFVESMKSDRVRFRDGKLAFFAGTSTKEVVTWLIVLVTCGGLAVWGVLDKNSKVSTRVLGVGVSVLGTAVASGFLLRTLMRTGCRTPFVELSNDGMYLWGKKLVAWQAFYGFSVMRNVAVNYMDVILQDYQTAELYDKNGKTLAFVSDQSPQELQVSVDNFITLVNYYAQRNKVST